MKLLKRIMCVFALALAIMGTVALSDTTKVKASPIDNCRKGVHTIRTTLSTGDAYGHTYRTYCQVCNKTISETKETHRYDSYRITGHNKIYACSVCGFNKTEITPCEYVYETTATTHTKVCRICNKRLASESHTKVYRVANSLRCEVRCTVCGYFSYETHRMQKSNYTVSNNYHTYSQRCVKCGYAETRNDSHNFNGWVSSANTHTRYCFICNYVQTQTHNYTTVVSATPMGDYHRIVKQCSVCGIRNTFMEAHTFSSTGVCTICGYRKR
jgi:hypothetical protein